MRRYIVHKGGDTAPVHTWIVQDRAEGTEYAEADLLCTNMNLAWREGYRAAQITANRRRKAWGPNATVWDTSGPYVVTYLED